MKKEIIKVFKFFTLIGQTVSSCVLIILFSSFRVAYRTKKECLNNSCCECVVLGNGPSLKEALEKDEVKHGVTYMALNLFVKSEHFWKLRPRYYFLADDAFWNPQDERNVKVSADFIDAMNRVSWPLTLYVPTQKNIKKLVGKLHNDNVKIYRMNTIQVNGFRWFRNLIYRLSLGMPRCQTVLNMTLVGAINMGYKVVYLYGADHSWTRDLMVDDDNVVYYGDRHVYSTDLTRIKLNKNLGTLLRNFAEMFNSHYVIRDYANSVGCKIINCTEGSFVDAYERLEKQKTL